MTPRARKIYRRILRRFTAGKLRSKYTGKVIRSEKTARRIAKEAGTQAEKEEAHD